MYKTIILLFLLGFFSTNYAQKAVNMQFQISGLQTGEKVYLGYYYGNKSYIKDTTISDTKGKFAFSYTELLDKGVYLLVFPADSNHYVEFVIDDDQQFEMSAKKTDIIESAVFKGSMENTIFFNYYKTINELKTASNTTDTLKLRAINERYINFKKDFLVKYANSYTAKILTYQERPVIPASMISQTAQFYYYRSHFFDLADLEFTPIVRSSSFHPFIMEYIDKLTIQQPDSIITACDILLSKLSSNKEAFKYTLITLLNKYATSKIVCFDNIYIHLVDEYYLKGKAFWLNPTVEADVLQLNKLKDRVEALRSIQCGKKVANFTLQDENGKSYSLYDIKSPYTLLMFWSTDCQHCEQSIKKMKNIGTLLEDKGVTFITIAEGSNRELWLSKKATFPIKNILALMTTDGQVVQSIVENYDVYSTPEFYFLDEDKNLIYKKFDVEDLTKIVNQYAQ